MEELFTIQEKLLNRPSQVTLDIYGTNASVSTPAIKNQSRILAQNDRKIMLFKHDDNSVSLHVFIGATGVNRVDVDPRAQNLKQGDRQGDMQFGPDTYLATKEFQAAGSQTTRDGLKKLRIGDTLGSFPVNGSTVISYYLPKDFALLPKIDSIREAAVYGSGINRTEIEIKAKMGDPLLIKTEIALARFLRKKHNNEFFNSEEDIKNYVLNMKLNNDSKELTMLKKIFGHTQDDLDIKLRHKVVSLLG